MTDGPHPFTIANFRYLWAARFASMLSQYAMTLIIGWQAYNLAREDMGVAASAGILGLIGLLQFVPLFILTPLVGWVADRLDRRWIARAVFAVQVLIAVLLTWLTWNSAISLPAIYCVAILLGICRAFIGPALSALAPNLVPAASLPRAIALSTIAWQVGVIVGPAFAGPLYSIEPALPYAVCAILYLFALTGMMLIGPVPRSEIDRSKGPFRQVADGLSYVWTNKLVLGAITLDLFVMFLAGAQAMLPVFARDVFNTGATGLSFLAAAPAVGAVITAGWFSWRPLTRNVGARMLMAMGVFGFATIGFAVSGLLGQAGYLPNAYIPLDFTLWDTHYRGFLGLWFALALLCLAICGAADMFGVFVRSTLIQLHTPDNKRGRVGAVSQMTISASNELGDAFTGGLAVLLGPILAIVAGGAGAMVITAYWSRLFPQLGAAKTFDPSDEVLVSEPSEQDKESTR